ncbi:MAG: DNA methylase [Verrucomicrobia bacterium]|nr:DNA methylase [Verrucomicrobiota bacterium]
MAASPAHRFGQIIGEVLEAAVEPLLSDFARKHGLYLDRHGPRPARPGNKVTWRDQHGNAHDLDFVLERGGGAEKLGSPVAFIETAWRRYTKHSRNKAQEIQGAILPLLETHRTAAPFAGVILGGVFTEGALNQLRSLGFAVVYFSYETIQRAFRGAGIDARSDEDTPDAEFAKKVKVWNALSPARRGKVSKALVGKGGAQLDEFMRRLERTVARRIESVRVLPLHGVVSTLPTVEAAIAFIEHHQASASVEPLVGYEIQVRYSNGDRIEGRFSDKAAAVAFLQNYQHS